MNSYQSFLASKRLVVQPSGIDVSPDQIHAGLKPHQRDLVRWGVRKGRSGFFAATGLGKTRVFLEAARLTTKRALIVAPLGVTRQTVDEAARIGVDVVYARRQEDAPTEGITVTNYEMVHHFNPDSFDGVALDECFAKGTLIDVPSGRMHIEALIIGDEILNASGTDRVSDVHRREVPYAVRITVNGQAITSSPNHPYFTRRGWVGAQDLIPGDEVVATAEAVRMVRQALYGAVCPDGQEAVLQSVLLSEMAHEPAGASRQSAYAGSRSEARRQAPSLPGGGFPGRARGDRTYPCAESNAEPRDAGKGLPPIEGDGAQTFRAWGQRPWLDEASTDLAGCTRTDLGSGISFVVGSTDSRLSHELQARLSRSRAANQYRGGWSLPLQPEGRRCEAGREDPFSRVDGLEVLEPGHPDLECLRDADGKLYFYDLGATRHPSFSVGGLLVHNSSILKDFEGKTRFRLIAMFRDTPYRWVATATPSPNDVVELANYAEFLGIMSRAEMLATWFVHDDQGWRLKGHAREPFYRWLASWAMSLKRPSDLGYPDDGYLLPELAIHPTIVGTDWTPPGQLFPTALKGVSDRAAVRKATLTDRVRAAAELIAAEPDESWIAWCGLNAEQDALTAALGSRCISIDGTLDPEEKVARAERWQRGEVPVLVTKAAIYGHGVNWQHCARMVFVGLSDSFEAYHQTLRRCWRFGQTKPVHAYVVLTEPEEAIYANVLRKEREFEAMTSELVAHVAAYERTELGDGRIREELPRTQPIHLPTWMKGVE